jgi:hypothetical protein
MKLQWTSHFVRAYSRAPKEIQQAFDKQSLLLLQNPRHPSSALRSMTKQKVVGRPVRPVTGGSTFE